MQLLVGRGWRPNSMLRFRVSGHLTTGVSPDIFAFELIGHSETAGHAELRADQELIHHETPMPMGLMMHRTGRWTKEGWLNGTGLWLRREFSMIANPNPPSSLSHPPVTHNRATP